MTEPITLLAKWRLAQAIAADPNTPPSALRVALRLLDHLNGKMYFDRLSPLKRKMLVAKAEKLRGRG